MSPKDFEQIVSDALDQLPEEIAQHLENVVIAVEPRPTKAQLRDLDLDDPMELYGLYEGEPLTERSLLESGTLPDKITIFQQPLERDFRGRARLIHEIQKTVAHEIAHLFGIDEDRLDELGLG